MRHMFLSVVVLVNLDTATLTVEHPHLAISTPVIVGKFSTPTPEGVYVLEKAYSSRLKFPMLVFRREEGGVYAIHPSLKSRRQQLLSGTPKDNALSAGCIGIGDAEFNKLWKVNDSMILQVYRGTPP